MVLFLLERKKQVQRVCRADPEVRREGTLGRRSVAWPVQEEGEGLGISWRICGLPREAPERLAQATLSTEFIVLGFLGQGFYLAWDLWHLLLMNVYS